MTKNILIVDDDAQMRLALKQAVTRFGYNAIDCENPEIALKKLENTNFSLVITDMKMPIMDGLTFLKEIRKRIFSLPVLVITGFGTVENAVETMKEGATDYLMKPFSLDALENAIKSVISRSKINKELVIANIEMKKLINLCGNLAASDITVLITGESGTGKELLARYIHKNSKRTNKPLVAVNCAAIPDNLLESELFGYEKGAFTGASEKKIGKFELANGGTILLDEIGEMSILLQAKLLRVLQEKEIDRIGGKSPIPIDVRVIATTNRDLNKECSEGRFREDLYYRLAVFPVKIPPLRERTDDIPALANHFLAKYSTNPKTLSEKALELLKRMNWKGNVRELENVIQRSVILSQENVITENDLKFDLVQNIDNVASNSNLKDMEKELILKTLKNVKGNKTKAADILGVSVRTIRNKLVEYGIKE